MPLIPFTGCVIPTVWDGAINSAGLLLNDYDVKALAAYLKAKAHEGDHQVIDLRAKKQTAEKIGLEGR